jgi:hypothetical protein
MRKNFNGVSRTFRSSNRNVTMTEYSGSETKVRTDIIFSQTSSHNIKTHSRNNDEFDDESAICKHLCHVVRGCHIVRRVQGLADAATFTRQVLRCARLYERWYALKAGLFGAPFGFIPSGIENGRGLNHALSVLLHRCFRSNALSSCRSQTDSKHSVIKLCECLVIVGGNRNGGTCASRCEMSGNFTDKQCKGMSTRTWVQLQLCMGQT